MTDLQNRRQALGLSLHALAAETARTQERPMSRETVRRVENGTSAHPSTVAVIVATLDRLERRA